MATCPPTRSGSATRPTTCNRPRLRSAQEAAVLLLGKGMHHLVIQTTPADLVFRFGLRPLVVALDPLRSGSLPTARRWLRAFPRGARRAGAHLRQGRNRRLASTNGALAGRV